MSSFNFLSLNRAQLDYCANNCKMFTNGGRGEGVKSQVQTHLPVVVILYWASSLMGL